jgi:phage-related protein
MATPLQLTGLEHLKTTANDLSHAMGDAFKGMLDTIKAFEQPVKTALDLGKQVNDLIGNVLSKTLKTLVSDLAKAGTAIQYIFGGLAGKIASSLAPIGSKISGALSPIGNLIGGMLSKIKVGSGGGTGGVIGDALGKAKSALIGATQGKAADVLKGLIGGIGKFAGAAGAAAGAVIGLGQAMVSMVGKANPAFVQQFQVALDDLQATVGRALIPVFEVVIQVTRVVGDTIATFANTIGSVLGTVANAVMPILVNQFEVLGHIGQALGDVLKALTPATVSLCAVFTSLSQAMKPLMNVLIDALGGAFVTVLGNVAKAIAWATPYFVAWIRIFERVVSTIVGWIRQALEYIGLLDAEKPGTAAGASVGQAAKSANIGDPKDILAAAQKAAFSLGKGDTPEAKVTNAIDKAADKIIEEMGKLPEKLATAIRDYAKDKVRDTVARVVPGVDTAEEKKNGTGKSLFQSAVDTAITNNPFLGSTTRLFGKVAGAL